MERYILKYLYDYSNDSRKKRFLDYMKVQLDIRLWSMGNHIPYSFDYQYNLLNAQKKNNKNVSFFRLLKRYLRSFFIPNKVVDDIECIEEKIKQNKYKVLSLIDDFPKESNELFSRAGIGIFNLSECDKTRTPATVSLQKWYQELSMLSFNNLLLDTHYNVLDELFNAVLEEMRMIGYDALIVRTSELFFEKFFIDVFKEINKPSITLLHGLPGVYTQTTENRSDYLLVWGDKIKKNFESVGYDGNRVLVAGNYKYCNAYNKYSSLRCQLEDVLVLTTSTYVEFEHEWEWDKFAAQDRSLLITYLYSIETVLKRVGVSNARLRPHPSVSKEWIADYIDRNFYELDYDEYTQSLSRATLCIGPTSSSFLEAMMNGVVYLVYEPGNGKLTMNNSLLVPPFDGSDKRLKAAYTEYELEQMIRQAYCPDISILKDYMQPLNVDVINKLLQKNKSM